MRAVVVTEPGGPDVLTVAEVDRPESAPGQVLIKAVAAGINRADLLQRQGHYPPPPGASEILGLEVSGHIAALGPKVTGWAVGDPCVALLAGGGYAEYVAVPAGQVLAPPPGLDLVDAAGVIEVAATVRSNLAGAAHLHHGEYLLVHGGAGGIGAFAIQYAKALGALVIATAGSPEKLDYCRSLGAHHTVSYRDDWPAAVREITDGHGVDVILDNMGAKYLGNHIALLARDGRLIILGMQGGTKATLDIGALMSRRGTIISTSLRSRPVEQKSALCSEVAREVWPLLDDGTIKPPRTTRFPLADAAAAHRLLESGDSIGKVVLTF